MPGYFRCKYNMLFQKGRITFNSCKMHLCFCSWGYQKLRTIEVLIMRVQTQPNIMLSVIIFFSCLLTMESEDKDGCTEGGGQFFGHLRAEQKKGYCYVVLIPNFWVVIGFLFVKEFFSPSKTTNQIQNENEIQCVWVHVHTHIFIQLSYLDSDNFPELSNRIVIKILLLEAYAFIVVSLFYPFICPNYPQSHLSILQIPTNSVIDL